MGPLRYRGQQDELKVHQQRGVEDDDFINLELQEVSGSRNHRAGAGFTSIKLFHTPKSFFASNWTPGFWVFITLVALSLIVLTVHENHARLPKALLEDPTAILVGPERFSAGRALVDLNSLISIGPRPTGSNENEVIAVNFLRNEILKIKEKCNNLHTISTADQVVTGSFFIGVNPVGYISFYDHVQNIVVRLSSSSHRNSTAVLLNCHYDSVPGSPGAGDDAFHCAVMLELLRILSRSTEPFLHDIIFLFNGAEETVLQASHGFITQHEWAKDVKAFVNLEGCGAGGKEILFQTGPNCPWLVETYAKSVPHPHGTVIAEELFQSGVIPSDTDFRIFRDFGHIPGYDFANIANGFVYHTKFDNEKLILPGAFQHTGDNILALVSTLASSSDLDSIDRSGESMIYFDLFSVWFVQYSRKFGTVLNIVVTVLSLVTIFGQLFRLGQGAGIPSSKFLQKYGFAILGTLGGWISSILYIILLTLLLKWTNHTQSWYQSFLYQFSLYYCPTTLFCVLGPYLCFYKAKLPIAQWAQMNSLATQFLWTNLLLFGTLLHIRSSYLILLVILSSTLCNLAPVFCSSLRLSSSTWMKIQWLGAVLPLLSGIYHTILTMAVFVPITNRSGSGMNVELTIGLLSAATCILSISFLIPYSSFIRHVSVVVWIGLFHLLGLLALFVFHPSPFYVWQNGESGVLQRVPLWHVQRTLYNGTGTPRYFDSGFWMMNMDPSSPRILMEAVPELISADKASKFCETELFCALPLYSPRMANYIHDSLWISRPDSYKHSILQMAAHIHQLTPSIKRINFTLSGPPQMSLMFSPLAEVSVNEWSLQADLKPSSKFKERPAYFVFYQRGLPGPNWTFSVDFKHKKNYTANLVTVTAVGSHIDTNYFSPEFKGFMMQFPSWTFVSPRASELKSWEL